MLRQQETRNSFLTDNRNLTYSFPHSNTPNAYAPQYHRNATQSQTNAGTEYIIQIIQLIDILLEKTQRIIESKKTNELEQIKKQISILQKTIAI